MSQSRRIIGWKIVVFNVYNIFFMFLGTVNLVAYFYELQMGIHYINLFYSSTFLVALYFLLVASCLILVSSFIGILSTKTKNNLFVYIYLMILILVILFELVIVITSYLYSTNLDFILKEEFNKTFLIEYKHGTDKSISVDFVQQNEACCGIYSYADWSKSNWKTYLESQLLPITYFVPESCCKSISEACGSRIHPSNIYYEGCYDSAGKKIHHFLQVLLFVSLGTFTVPIIGIILGVRLYQVFIKLRQSKEDELIQRNFK